MTEEKKETLPVDEMETAEEATVTEESTETVEEKTTEQLLQEEIETLKAQLADEQERHLRLRADFDNVRRRQTTEREAMQKYRAQGLLTDLLPVLDNFERALQVEATTEESASIVKGIEMVYKSLVEAVEKEGLTVIEALGKEFDPNFHQAVMQEQDADQPSGVVLREMQKGYQLKDRVIRPSMVSVNE